MELSSNHRKAILKELQAAIANTKQLENFERIEEKKIEKTEELDSSDPRDRYIIDSIHMDQWINEQKIKFLEQALIDNEIDW